MSSADVVQTHLSALNAVQEALISLLLAPNSTPQTVATQLHAQLNHCPDPKPILHHILKKATVAVLKEALEEPSNAHSAFTNALAIVDCAIVLLRNRHVDEMLPCTLLEFVFAFCTRAQLSKGIDPIRQRFDAYRRATTTPRTHLYLIKAAMSCINRDQKGSDPVLSGRLRLMLAAALPVWHPSGLNRRGQVNEANKIDYEEQLKDDDSKHVDVALYKAFWGIQQYMQNPSLAEDEHTWRKPKAALEKVLDAYETITIPEGPGITLENPSPKYMTAPSVLQLQLVDVRVRRHVLVQIAIFLHHLEVVGETAPTEKEAPATQEKHLFCKSLFESGGEGDMLRGRVFALLERDSAGKFKRFISSLLQRERKWIDWKKRTGYKHLNDLGHEPPKVFKRRRVLSPIPDSSGPVSKKTCPTGPREWQLRQSSWEVLPVSERMTPFKDPHRSMVPSVQTLKGQLKEDMDDPEITEDLKRKNDKKFVWRALRLLCEESMETVMQVIDSNSKSGYDLELWIKKEKGAPEVPERREAPTEEVK